jgi:hypothetical protein
VVQDESADLRPRSDRRAGTGKALLFAGVAGACVLGAGLGLWARPSDLERPGAPKAAAPVVTPISTDRRIPIVVDDSPAPIGKPLDVLTPQAPRPAVIPRRPALAPQAAPPEPEMIAPSRPPSGLVRVAAPVPGPMAPTAPRPAPRPAPPPVAARPDPRLLQAKADAARAHAEKLQEARLAKAEHRRELAEQAAEAKADAKIERLARLKARHDKIRAHEIELAKAAAPKPRHGLAALAHAFARLAPHHTQSAPEQRAEARPEPRHKKPASETRLAKAAPRPRAEPPQLMAKAAGTIRVATIPRCASADPGEALACGDPSLGAAERRLARAYRDAEAAGVPASTLATQQQRWKQARAAAAREAPWAVREVYQARIAELQDLTRDAKGE